MVIVSRNPWMWVVGMATSLIIFAVVYFTVIQPDQNTANQALKSGLQQTQQAINSAQKQLGSASSQASGAGSAASQAAGQAQQQLSNASKLTSCVAAAGTDVSKVQACDAKFGK
jgi:hypothetical protein